MKRIAIFLAVLVIIIATLMFTTPNRQQHADTINHIMMSAVNIELRNNHIDGAIGSIASVAAHMAIDSFLNTRLLVRDNTFYSLGFVDYNGEFNLVSVGVFGRVYTLNEDQARLVVKNKIGDFDLHKLIPKQ